MSIATLILGESGTGKTASLRNLDPDKTLLIQCIPKPLSFRSRDWTVRDKEKNPTGNIYVSDAPINIILAMQRTTAEVIVVDDFQYVMANEFMRRRAEKGFEKFTEIGGNAWDIFNAAAKLAEHKRVYILAHTQSDELGRTRIKTIGKMLDDKITLEGMVSIVLRTTVTGGDYGFSTRNNGSDTVKTPMGMFDADVIDNDLSLVDQAICAYYDSAEFPDK